MFRAAVWAFAFQLIISQTSPAAISSQAGAPSDALILPPDTAILAKLNIDLDLRQCKPGDLVEAQTTEDVKQGKTVLLKKGSTLLGHVSLVEGASAAQPQAMIGVVLDGVKAKNGPQKSLILLIRALRPEPEETSGSTISEGRGMPGATSVATIPGHVSAGEETGGKLTTSSVGVRGIANVHLGSRKDPKGPEITIFAVSTGQAKLKKGTQLVVKVLGP